jgi:hypothetical protein
MPDPDSLTRLTIFLQQYGGWAVSVILMAALLYLHRTTGNLLERRNSEIKALLAECKSVIAENRIFMERVEDAMTSVDSSLEKFIEVSNHVKIFLEDLRRRR